MARAGCAGSTDQANACSENDRLGTGQALVFGCIDYYTAQCQYDVTNSAGNNQPRTQSRYTDHMVGPKVFFDLFRFVTVNLGPT